MRGLGLIIGLLWWWSMAGSVVALESSLSVEAMASDLVSSNADPAPRLYALPQPGDDLIGELMTAVAYPDDTMVSIAHRYRVGYNAIRSANPAVDAWLPRSASVVVLPTRQLLPMAEREGIVVNVAEMRLYYFIGETADAPARVAVFPVSVGRGDWSTPLAMSRVTRKAKDPNWYPPESIRAEHAAAGNELPRVVPGGPDNPLGRHALYLNLPGYLLHGSNKQFGIGMQVTHGCLRLYPEHIAYLYEQVPVGTPVRLVHQRFKLGWSEGVLYLEVHPPLDGEVTSLQVDLELLTIKVSEFIRQRTAQQEESGVLDYPVDWERARLAVIEAAGIPVAIGPVVTQVVTGSKPTEQDSG